MPFELTRGARCDLHMHSTRSDGRFEPEEVVSRAAQGGLDLIALTDHDLPPAVPNGQQHLHGRRIYVLAGCEVTGSHEGQEFHLLVYFSGEVPEGFRAFCADQAHQRLARYEAALARLGKSDLPAPDESARRGERTLTRLHLARALVDAGHAASVQDAFTRYLSPSRANVPCFELPFVVAIRIARGFGGVTSWAHPSAAVVERYLTVFVSAGLQGIEGMRPGLGSKERNTLRKAARRHSLFVTGGSDWHGWADPDDLGLFAVPRDRLDELFQALQAA